MITVYFNQNPYTKKSYFVDKHEIQETNEGYKIKTYYRRGDYGRTDERKENQMEYL